MLFRSLGFVISKKHFDRNGKPNDWAQFDTGAAWMSFTLQAFQLGYMLRGMGGIKKEAVYTALNIDPEKYDVLMGFAMGKYQPTSETETLSGRNDLSSLFSYNSL